MVFLLYISELLEILSFFVLIIVFGLAIAE